MAPVLLLALLYVILRIIKFAIIRFANKNNVSQNFKILSYKLDLLFPPLVILVISINLLWLDIKTFGPVLGLFTAIFYKQIRSYGLGKMMQFQGRIKNGYHISTSKIKGEISKLKPFEIKVETDLGTKHISYTNLQNEEHTISTFANVPVKYKFEVGLPNEVRQDHYMRKLKFLLLETPQVEAHSVLDLVAMEENKIKVTLCVGDEEQVEELKQLLDEKNFLASKWTAIV